MYRLNATALGLAALLLTTAAHADDSALQARANALVQGWFAQDTAQNRQLARSNGPLVSDAVFQPRISRQKRIYSRLPSIPHFHYKDARGPAMLAITERGPGVRYWQGHLGKRVNFHGQVVKRSNEVSIGKVKPLAPRWLPKKLSMRVAKWRAQRMMRRAVKAGLAPSPAAIERSFKTSRR